MEKIFVKLIKDKEIIVSEIVLENISINDLDDMISKNIITYNDKYYVVNDINLLNEYGNNLLLCNNLKKAEGIFRMCNNIDSNYLDSYFNLFLLYVNNRNNDGIVEMCDILFEKDKNKVYLSEVNYFLFLLNLCNYLPSKYKEYVKTLNYDRLIRYSNNKLSDTDKFRNRIRLEITRGKNISAIEILKKVNYKRNTLTFKDIVEEEFVLKINEEDNLFKYNLINNIRMKNYDVVLKFINERNSKYPFNKYNNYLLFIVNDILEIINNNSYPSIANRDNYNTIFDAIKSRDYVIAFKMCDEFNKKNNTNSINNPLYLVLRDINYLLANTKKDNNKDYFNLGEISNRDKQLVLDSYNLLKDKSVIVFNYMDSNRITLLLREFNKYPNIKTFVYGDTNKQFIMIKKVNKEINHESLYKEADRKYQNRNFSGALYDYFKLIEYYDRPNSFLFGRIGMILLKMGRKEDAIKYLSIATEIRDKNKNSFDYTELIQKLKGDISPEDMKKSVKVSLDEFSDDDNFGISNFYEFNQFVMSSGMDIENASKYFNMSLEDLEIIRLLYARELYSVGYMKEGDLFIKAVERSKNKTPRINKHLLEVRNNKKFYEERRSGKTLTLNLGIKP